MAFQKRANHFSAFSGLARIAVTIMATVTPLPRRNVSIELNTLRWR